MQGDVNTTAHEVFVAAGERQLQGRISKHHPEFLGKSHSHIVFSTARWVNNPVDTGFSKERLTIQAIDPSDVYDLDGALKPVLSSVNQLSTTFTPVN